MKILAVAAILAITASHCYAESNWVSMVRDAKRNIEYMVDKSRIYPIYNGNVRIFTKTEKIDSAKPSPALEPRIKSEETMIEFSCVERQHMILGGEFVLNSGEKIFTGADLRWPQIDSIQEGSDYDIARLFACKQARK
ncbi:hypothetical protein [Geomonas anaerohicana]|uniref:Uncharacterized protein n=1 Tax=Geomonas anaerohicana TaxID=2798583 RepID=A0ABS0YK42_9BACT|nr:hypothetical protein [Geomonas anaerohicana]MBJ6752694.1 hypothetical protein [Geomonas anaerohicana]